MKTTLASVIPVLILLLSPWARADIDHGAVATVTNAVTEAHAQPPSSADSAELQAGAESNYGPNELRLNFRGAPIAMVLEYLSDAAGFTIDAEVQPRGTIDLWSETPVTREEAFHLLNAALLKNGNAAIRKGQVLTIINRDEAKTHALPVKVGGDPQAIPDDQELVTQILPVRFVEAAQLLKDIQPLVSSHAILTANESANTIVMTDTQGSIRRIAEVIQAIDGGSEAVTAVRLFTLKNADPLELADLLTQLFPQEQSTSGAQPTGMGSLPFAGPGGMGGPGSPPGMGFPGGSSASPVGSATSSARLKKGQQMLAVGDARTSSIAVSAPAELMTKIADVIRQLDTDPAHKQTVKVFSIKNASVQEVAKVLQDLFQKDGTTTRSSSGSSSSWTDPLETRANNQRQTQSTASGTTGFAAGQGGGGNSGGGSSSGQ